MASAKSQVKAIWLCDSCGHEQSKWTGQCLSCRQWNCLKEFKKPKVLGSENAHYTKAQESKIWRLNEVPTQECRRIPCKINEFDDVMGGGLVPGSMTLLGGEPGIGKSTLLLQLSQTFANQGQTVLYVSGEESLSQIALRAQRLHITADQLMLLSDARYEEVERKILECRPKIVIIDSIQILAKSHIPSAAGSPLQLRECTSSLLHLAKVNHISMILIGHITKSGDLAGPKVLEHMVDTVLTFESEPSGLLRFLRASKNRFGPTDELAVFSMGQTGLQALKNPSTFFLRQRQHHPEGSVICPILEGSRAFLIDVQALVCKSSYAQPMRKGSGIDGNRLTILLAVLQTRSPLSLFGCDVFINLSEGIKVQETSLDLAVLLAIASATYNKALIADTAVFGEVGLSGEVRPVKGCAQRIRELQYMGFKRCILSKANLQENTIEKNNIELIGVSHIDEALRQAFYTGTKV